MSKVDNSLVILLRELYNINEKEKNEFLSIINSFTEEEKKKLAYLLWEKLENRKQLLKTYTQRLRIVSNKLTDFKTRVEADDLLSQL